MVEGLPELEPLTVQDDRLRQVPADAAAVRRAIAMATTALAAARGEGDVARVRRLLAYLGEAHRVIGALEEAEREIREALILAREAADARGGVANLIRLGEVLRCGDRPGDAEAALRDALAGTDGPGCDVYRDFALQHLGKTLLDTGRVEEARAVLRDALAIRQRKGAPSLIASTQEALARADRLHPPRGRLPDARTDAPSGDPLRGRREPAG